MKTTHLVLAAAVALTAFGQPKPPVRAAGAAAKPKVKLVLGVVVDQFRADYLYRFQNEYSGGLARLLKNGAVFTNAHYEHFPTVTAIGHSTFFSGATPSISGIVGNSWYDRATGKVVTSVSDESTDLVGAQGAGSSPRKLLVSTIADELKMSGKGGKAIGISLKDRSAILPVGHMADGAYWFDIVDGSFVTSTYYRKELPAWVSEYNAKREANRMSALDWIALDGKTVFPPMTPKRPETSFASIEYTPFANEMIEALAERALDAEKLGQGDKVDVLTVSFSANDYVGHAKGPDSPEVHDITVRTDRLFQKLFQYVDQKVGLANVLIVMSADHGVAPTVEANQARKMPGQRVDATQFQKAITAALNAKYGEGKWIEKTAEYGYYFDQKLIAEKKLDPDEVATVAAKSIAGHESIFRVVTKAQLASGSLPMDRFNTRVVNGFFAQRAPDLVAIQKPYFLLDKTGTTHGLPFSYDTHVPVIFMGPGVKAGRYHRAASPNDIAPTLATMLQIETPSGAFGRVLEEMLQ